MQTTHIQPDYPANPDETATPEGFRWRSAVSSVLSGLRGWQAIPASAIAIYIFVGVFGPVLAPFEPNRGTISDRQCPPLAINALTTGQHQAFGSSNCSAANVLGTDDDGRDIFSRLLHGAQASLLVVGPSVVIGTFAGTVVGCVINGWRRGVRLIAYLILILTIVPLGIFLSSGYLALGTFYVITSDFEGFDWASLTVFSSVSSVITLAIVAIAYRYDETCRSGWLANADVDTDFPNHSFGRKLHRQIVALAPWIVLASIACAALVFLRYVTISAVFTEIGWSFVNYFFVEHIGIYGLFVPQVFIPIAFVSLAIWWAVHGLLSRFEAPSMPVPSADRDLEAASDEQLSICSMSTDEDSDHSGIQTKEDEAALASTAPAQNMDRRRWILTVVAIVMAVVVIRFGYAEALPTIRQLGQDWTSDHYQSPLARSLQELDEAMNCARELSSQIRTVPGQLEAEADQRCLDLYFQQRNAPTHRWTINYAARFFVADVDACIDRVHSVSRFMGRRLDIDERDEKVDWCLRRSGRNNRADDDVCTSRMDIGHWMVRSDGCTLPQRCPRLFGRAWRLLSDDSDREANDPLRKSDAKVGCPLQMGVLFRSLHFTDVRIAHPVSLPIPLLYAV